MSKKTTVISVIVILVLLFVAGSFIYFTRHKQTNQPVKTDQALIKIGIIVYPGFAPFYLAQEKGFFQKEGINGQIVLINDPNQAASALASNQVQILFSSVDFTTFIASTGIDAKEIFASDIGYGSDGLLVKNNIKSIKDLKGKTVYMAMGTPSEFLFRYMQQQAGVPTNDIKVAQMGIDQIGAAFVAGKIDYGMSWEPWLSEASQRKDGKLLFSSRDYPGIVTDTFITRADVLQSRRNDVKAVMRAWFDSLNFIKSNPDEANAIMAKNLGLSVDSFKTQMATIKFLDYNENLTKFSTSTNLNIYQLTDKATEIYKTDSVIDAKVKISTDNLIDPTLLQDLYK